MIPCLFLKEEQQQRVDRVLTCQRQKQYRLRIACNTKTAQAEPVCGNMSETQYLHLDDHSGSTQRYTVPEPYLKKQNEIDGYYKILQTAEILFNHLLTIQ